MFERIDNRCSRERHRRREGEREGVVERERKRERYEGKEREMDDSLFNNSTNGRQMKRTQM